LRKDLPEIQADSNADIARHGALTATQHTGHAVAREDHGFFLNAFPGWPGPYMAHSERTIPPGALLDLLTNKDRTGFFEVALAYAEPSGATWESSYQVPVEVLPEPQPGSDDFGWDSILSIPGTNVAFSQKPASDRYQYFTHNFEKLGQRLQQLQNDSTDISNKK